MKAVRTRSIILYLLLGFLLISTISGFFTALGPRKIDYSEALQQFQKGTVETFEVYDNVLQMQYLKDGKHVEVKSYIPSKEAFLEDVGELLPGLQEQGTLKSYRFRPDSKPGILEKTAPYLLAGSVLLIVWAYMGSRAAGSNPGAFTKAKANLGVKGDPVDFSSVAGAEEEKEELREVVEFLQNPQKYKDMGAKVPKGILLVGPPGTGKTLLAQAVAGEAGVQFLSISGSDFVELYVGVGAGRVRDLFEQAKKIAPAIIFIDEIDAVGRRRGAGMGGGHDEREQTLNQLLVEMDGFQKTEGVIVLAATNRQDILDPALLRPGRFDRQIYVGAPDAKGRQEILKVHSKNKRLGQDVDLQKVAMGTAGFTGADLSNLLNEAAILAVRENRKVIESKDLDEAMMKVIAGPQKRSRMQLQRDLKITAIHEAGHAVAAYFLPTQDPVHQITIIPRGNALGMTVNLPTEDTLHRTRNEMYESIVMLLGGRVAESLYCGDITTGASNDIERATHLAREMVARYGMSERVGTICYEDDQEIFVGRDYEKTRSYSEQVAGTLDAEVKALVDRAYDHCVKLLRENESKLLKVSDYLLAHETMTGEDFRASMEGKEL